MPPSRFLLKIYGGFALVVLGSTLLTWWLVARHLVGEERAEIRSNLESRARVLAQTAGGVFEGLGVAAFQQRIRELGSTLETRFTVIRADGTVLADSDESPAVMDNHADRPEVREAIASGLGSSSRRSGTLGRDMQYLAVSVRHGDAVVGVVRTAFPARTVRERLGGLGSAVLGAALASALLVLVVGWVLAQRVTGPLAGLTRLAERVAAGEAVTMFPPPRSDELGDLTQALSRMATRLQERLELLRSERNKIVAVLAGMVEGVIAVDRDERLLHINDAATRLFGLQPAESAGRSLVELTRVPRVVEVLRSCLREKRTLRDEVRLGGASQDRRVELLASPLRNGAGQVTGAVLVLHDVTELRYLETVRRDFVANVSHELKTPLAAIRGLVETMDDDDKMSDEVRGRFLQRARGQVERLSALVTDLLVLSRLESREQDQDAEPCDLGACVEDAVRRFGEEITRQGLAIETQTESGRWSLFADPESLRQVIDNLLSNAIRYTPTGGQIWIRLREEHGSVILEVEDTGIGIEPAEQDRIFERFYRVDKARSREVGGTGLGLSIVKHVTEGLGGQVMLESRPGKGSSFRVRLPLRAVAGTEESSR